MKIEEDRGPRNMVRPECLEGTAEPPFAKNGATTQADDNHGWPGATHRRTEKNLVDLILGRTICNGEEERVAAALESLGPQLFLNSRRRLVSF